MKCKICGRKINYDCSIGRDTFLVCNECAYKLAKRSSLDNIDILKVILDIGFIKEEFKNLKKGS